ncbi:DUF58 domain-containing protein [Allorhodopirellula heiligendammensis]|uniref:VWFA domain-containing protein n=1 Tax=Allorhodopirellula heiligendammensis TaxID=2714739 RepID=A0A5C6BFU2_9BACT|nr:DUF58 domain-containing protein [Allorhodopirellula heiligendammensis]TWU11055.1 hypothetical protein Poly21_49620 [Allorhodopirellula heiligendammensis]
MKSSPQTTAPNWLRPDELARLSSLELRARGVVEGFLQGLHRSPFVGYSVEFSSHRRYGPGDDLRHVNWKVFARQRKLYVKEFDAETNLNLYLLVDASRSMQCKIDGAMTKYEYAATLAAAMAFLALKQRDAVALGLMDDGVRQYLDPSVKPGRWEDCLRMLAQTPERPVTELAKSLEQAAAVARHRGIVIVLSDMVDDVAGIQRGLQQLRHRGHEVVLFHILDPFERYLAKQGRVRVLDMEGSADVTTDVESIRGDYLHRIEQWCDELEDVCRHQGVDRLELTTDQPPTGALVDYLVRRTR